MRREQHFRGGRFEGYPAFGANDGIAQMNPAADAEGTAQSFERFDDGNSGQTPAIETVRHALRKTNGMALGRARMRERILRQDPRLFGNAALGSQGFLAADG